MKDPMVQKRTAVGDGGRRDIPPARTQCFSNSMRDLVLMAARKPCVTATMASASVSSRRRAWRCGCEWELIIRHIRTKLKLCVVCARSGWNGRLSCWGGPESAFLMGMVDIFSISFSKRNEHVLDGRVSCKRSVLLPLQYAPVHLVLCMTLQHPATARSRFALYRPAWASADSMKR